MFAEKELEEFKETTEYYVHNEYPTVFYTDGIKFLIENELEWFITTIVVGLEVNPDIREHCTDFLAIELTTNEDGSGIVEYRLGTDKPVIGFETVWRTECPIKSLQVCATLASGNWVLHLPAEQQGIDKLSD